LTRILIRSPPLAKTQRLAQDRSVCVESRKWQTGQPMRVGRAAAAGQRAALNAGFGTVPLTAGQWAACVAMASIVLWFSELRKLVTRAASQAAPG
jgi:hypothetical protein